MKKVEKIPKKKRWERKIEEVGTGFCISEKIIADIIKKVKCKYGKNKPPCFYEKFSGCGEELTTVQNEYLYDKAWAMIRKEIKKKLY